MDTTNSIRELHWLLGVLNAINVGFVVIDKDYKINMWNSFMADLSGIKADEALGNPIFSVFSELPEEWLRKKIGSVFMVGARSFTTWEQRPFLFKFKNYRPITGLSDLMYQNATFIPLTSLNGDIDHVGILVYDVTDVAVNKLELSAANEQLSKLSRIDRLTELFNRGYWEERLAHEFERHQRSQQPTTLVMFDIDHFKKVNDVYGHPCGDEVIRRTAKTLLQTIRKTDVAGRYGGEEFAVILPDTTVENAYLLAERIRKRIEQVEVPYEELMVKYTISLGVAQLNPDMKTYKQWIEATDQSLYKSKEGGRNQTTIHRPAGLEVVPSDDKSVITS